MQNKEVRNLYCSPDIGKVSMSNSEDNIKMGLRQIRVFVICS